MPPKKTTKKDDPYYQTRKWSMHLSKEKNEKATELLQFLYKERIIDSLSRYRLVQMAMSVALKLFKDKNIINTMNMLYEEDIIKEKSFESTFEYLVRLGNYCITNNVELT